MIVTTTATQASERVALIARLRRYVENANPATLTCLFSPGGRVRGAGIVSHFHCVHCNQSRHAHDIAAVLRELELGENPHDIRCS